MLGQKKKTILDVAARAGVSRSTVSLVLQNSRKIPDGTRALVLRAIDDIGYRYNRNAANLRRQTSQVIGFVTSDVRNPYFAEMAAGVEMAADAQGYVMHLACAYDRLDRQQRIVDALAEHNVAGLIICPAKGSDALEMARLKQRSLPIVLAIRRLDQKDFDFVGLDNRKAALIATRHLIGVGHRSIAFVGGDPTSPTRVDRTRGYADALAEAGLDVRPALVSGPNDVTEHSAGLNWIVSHPARPTAALCYNDMIALRINTELHDRGMLAGRDLAILGFDDTRDAGMSFPRLSTMALYPMELGKQAFRVLSSRINDPSRAPETCAIESTLIVRDSCGG